jgi:hypothetical protein
MTDSTTLNAPGPRIPEGFRDFLGGINYDALSASKRLELFRKWQAQDDQRKAQRPHELRTSLQLRYGDDPARWPAADKYTLSLAEQAAGTKPTKVEQQPAVVTAQVRRSEIESALRALPRSGAQTPPGIRLQREQRRTALTSELERVNHVIRTGSK